MSTSYLSHRSRPSWTRPISSAILDELMSSSSTDDEKCTENPNSLQSSSKRPAKSDGTKKNNALQFTPHQLYKIKRTTTVDSEDNSSETTSSSPSQCRISGSLESRYSTPDKSSSTSSNKRSSTSLETGSSTNSKELENTVINTSDSSVYITPENTPTALNSSDLIIRPCVKRSLVEHYSDVNQSKPNLSLNSTTYYTPESSPIDQCSSVKRLKTRWSDAGSSCNSDVTEYLNLSDEDALQPELIGYQMIGDSQFCRFGQQLLGLQRVPAPNSPGRIGICVSGQTITDLHQRVKDKVYPISDKIILMIGTNDFLRNVDVTMMCKELSALIKTLQETVTNIVLLTLPPIPKLEKKQNTHHFKLLDIYNSYIRSLENGEKLRIADVSPLYMSSPPYRRCRMHLFELYFSGPNRRHDMIHLNRQGLEVIRKYILDNFL